MHDEWVRHRSSDRFFRNMKTIAKSGVGQALQTELIFVTMTSVFAVVSNCLIWKFQGPGGVMHDAPFGAIGHAIGPLALPSMPFTVAMPALSLLLGMTPQFSNLCPASSSIPRSLSLTIQRASRPSRSIWAVFRTNTAYSRWNEARTLWGGVVNTCRNVARQSNAFYPDTERGDVMCERMVANTVGFAKALRTFLRGPSDEPTLRTELNELEALGLIPPGQVDACMAASNRPMFQLSAMSANLKAADIGPMDRSRIDTSISHLADLTGACERIFKSPVPLVYTRHTARFLTTFLMLLPFGLWDVTGASWNHWATIPATFVIAFFLFGIEEIGIQIEEPFSILPLEALCDGAIEATMNEMTSAETINSFAFDDYYTESLERARFLMQAGGTYQQHERNLQQHNESPE